MDAGFEYRGTFYRWKTTTTGKDLLLIDRFSGLPVQDFFDLIGDDFDRGRVPILLTMFATSIGHGHPDWSIERIVRTVMALDLTEVVFIDGDEEEVPEGQVPPSVEDEPSGNGSSSESKPTSSAPAPEPSETFRRTPA